ncbi:MAG: diacylglycerol/lipid kinase family protein [Chloroflexota bacterium]
MSQSRTGRAILFANPRSGQARRWLFSVVEEARKQGVELASTHFDLEPQSVARALSAAREAGIDVVLVAGGDGTIGSVAQHLINTDFILGVLPAGTSNDFARSLLVPLSPPEALAVISRGVVSRVDVGKIGNRYFLHAATVGINSAFARAAQDLRDRFGRVSYPLAWAGVYRARKTFCATLTFEGGERELQGYEVALVNAPVYGGALELEIAGADLTDHRLQVVVIEDLELTHLLRTLPLALWRQRIRFPEVDRLHVQSGTLSTNPPLSITTDGEVAGETPADFSVLPGALRVFVPMNFLGDERAAAV